MTEAKQSAYGKLGLFATKAFKAGDEILVESPVVVLASSTAEKQRKPETSIKMVPESIDDDLLGTFRSMITVGKSWIGNSEKKGTEILDLYFPTAESSSKVEDRIRHVAKEALQHLQKTTKRTEDWETVEKVMLVWACNSFQGGRIYLKISRANHSCDPNSVIQAKGDDQKMLAATDIDVGDEITISYLGYMLYTETEVRREKLRKTKFFHCECTRCVGEDVAARIPCPSDHPREHQRSLDEDAQYDDDHTVKYIYASSESSALENFEKLKKAMAVVTSRVATFLDEQESAKEKKTEDNDSNEEILEEQLGVARTVMGDKHWTTNLLLLLFLDRRLSQISSTMLTTQQIPEMEDVAEIIDYLQRLYPYVESLKLKLHPGHILGDAIIGTARTLVSLGDIKSQKYGAEWLEKITDYVDKFESEGRQKVVSTLSVAWKKHDRESSDDGAKAKKQKS
ncbi:MAG: hypothetical protein SGBAC_005286 [Bacillariaceae sp.]